jgi:hypothetical protein
VISKREEVKLVPLRASYSAVWSPQVCSEVSCKVGGGIGKSVNVHDLRSFFTAAFRSQLLKDKDVA